MPKHCPSQIFPDKSCFVSFYQHIRRFRIYGQDGKLKRDVILDLFPGQECPEVDDNMRLIHPICVYTTDNYIYTLNLDMTTEDVEDINTHKLTNSQSFFHDHQTFMSALRHKV